MTKQGSQMWIAVVAIAVSLVLSPGIGAAANDGTVAANLRELWRVGDDELGDGPIFGIVTDLCLDPDGSLYVVDQQLSAISVFSPEGEFLGNIGREGDGPGEFRRPYRAYLTPAGEVCVLAGRSGHITRFSKSGDYLGDIEIPADSSGVVPVCRGILNGGQALVAHQLVRKNTDFVVAGERFEEHRIVRLDTGANLEHTYFRVGFPGNDARPLWTERNQALSQRWDVSTDGTVFVASSFSDYAISVFTASGQPAGMIARDYKHRKRSEEEKQAVFGWATLNPHGNLPGTKFEIEDYDKDIMALYCRGEDELWVLTSRGCYDRPEGSAGVFDVFGSDGSLERTVTLWGAADPEYDRYVFFGNRLYVVRCFKSALATMIAGGEENRFSEACLEPMSVVCYEVVFRDQLPTSPVK